MCRCGSQTEAAQLLDIDLDDPELRKATSELQAIFRRRVSPGNPRETHATASEEIVGTEMSSVPPELLSYFLFLQEGKLQYGICSRRNIKVDYSYPILMQHHSTFFFRNNKVNVICFM